MKSRNFRLSSELSGAIAKNQKSAFSAWQFLQSISYIHRLRYYRLFTEFAMDYFKSSAQKNQIYNILSNI